MRFAVEVEVRSIRRYVEGQIQRAELELFSLRASTAVRGRRFQGPVEDDALP